MNAREEVRGGKKYIINIHNNIIDEEALGGKSRIEEGVILIVDLYSKTGQGKRTSKYITRWKGKKKRRGESGRSRENIIEERGIR